MTMAACVEEVAAVRDGLGLHPFHVLGHLAGWLALEYAPKPLEGLAGSRFVSSHGRACGIVAGRGAAVRSQPGGCCLGCRAPTLMYATSPLGGSSGVVPLRCHFLPRQTRSRIVSQWQAGETLSCASTAPATSWGATAPTWRG